MIVTKHRVELTTQEMKNILDNLSRINNKAINLMDFGCIENADDFKDCNEISNIAVKLYGILADKFNVESNPQKGH